MGNMSILLGYFMILYQYLGYLAFDRNEGDNADEMSPGSSTKSYSAFFLIGLRENLGKSLNQCAVSSTQKFLVQQHITTSKHQANKQLNSKQRQLFLTQPTTSNYRVALIPSVLRRKPPSYDLNCFSRPVSQLLCEALRNIRHHAVRSMLAEALKEVGLQSIKRFETHADQPHEVDSEKKRIYEPTIPFYKDKYSLSYIDVIGLMLVSLKAELSRKQEEVNKAKAQAQAHYIRPLPQPKKQTVWTKQNAGVSERGEKDIEEQVEEDDVLKKSRMALEAKSKLYDKLSQSSAADDEGRFLVDFQQKSLTGETSSAALPPEENEEHHSSDEYDKTSDPEEDWSKIDRDHRLSH
ncbi:hypothetical protein ANN_13494 [Periplaneta americana]|uniref:Uncharacterized protein n=1 Tax=Periplaneta americana TaxID=6978 RepID=A0ABQ8TL10_PERAM|nr:hypothetical protein ANN_13494 [Periplaneta americana]